MIVHYMKFLEIFCPSQQMDVILELLCASKVEMSLNTTPANESSVCQSFLVAVWNWQFLNDPSTSTGSVIFGGAFYSFVQLSDITIELVLVSLRIVQWEVHDKNLCGRRLRLVQYF